MMRPSRKTGGDAFDFKHVTRAFAVHEQGESFPAQIHFKPETIGFALNPIRILTQRIRAPRSKDRMPMK